MESKKLPQKDLQKKYHLHLALGMAASLALVLMAFEWNSPVSDQLIDLGQDYPEVPTYDNDLLPPVREKRTAPPKPKVTVPVLEPTSATEPDQVDLPMIDDPHIIPEPELDFIAPPIEEAPVYETFGVDQQALPAEGWDGFRNHILKHLKYPGAARRMQIEGRVVVSFVVDARGEISAVKVLKGIGFGCDKEAIRVIQSLPNWTPARRGGRPVAVRMVLPIIFKLH